MNACPAVRYPSPQAAYRVVACMCKRTQGRHAKGHQGRLKAVRCGSCGTFHIAHEARK